MCEANGPPLRERIPRLFPSIQPLPIYLDHNATTPVGPEAWEGIFACQHAWGNPSSTHAYGFHAKYMLEEARKDIFKALDCPIYKIKSSSPSGLLDVNAQKSIIFTACGTEANNIAIRGTLKEQLRRFGRNIIISTNVEHPATAEPLKELLHASEFEILTVPVDPNTGVLDVAVFENVYRPCALKVALVTIMHANNETGSIQPIKEIVQCIHRIEAQSRDEGEKNIVDEGNKEPDSDLQDLSAMHLGRRNRTLIHTDAAQTVGKIPVSVRDLGVDLISVVGHKFYGPKGIAVLYCAPDIVPERVIFGAGHEHGIRPGTENIIMVKALACALTSAITHQKENGALMRACRDTLYAELSSRLARHNCVLVLNGSLDCALPNTLNCAIYNTRHERFISANRLLAECDDQLCASAGSACHSVVGNEDIKVSAPLAALGADIYRAMGTLRLSTGKMNTIDEMIRAARIITAKINNQFAEI